MRVERQLTRNLLLAVGAAWLALPACAQTNPAASARPALEKQDIRAQLTPRRFTTIAGEIGAKISRISVSEGGRFRAGQNLVSLDCSLQQAQLQKAKAALTAAERTYAANKRLSELNSIGKVELEVSEAEAAKARARACAFPAKRCRAYGKRCSRVAPISPSAPCTAAWKPCA